MVPAPNSPISSNYEVGIVWVPKFKSMCWLLELFQKLWLKNDQTLFLKYVPCMVLSFYTIFHIKKYYKYDFLNDLKYGQLA